MSLMDWTLDWIWRLRVAVFGPPRITLPGEKGQPMAGYRCCLCGTSGVKLWRWYMSTAEKQRLYCVDCAIETEEKTGLDVRDDGRAYSLGSWHDGIGYLVPAVPIPYTKHCYFGFGGVRRAAESWWRELPLRLEEEETEAERLRRLQDLGDRLFEKNSDG